VKSSQVEQPLWKKKNIITTTSKAPKSPGQGPIASSDYSQIS